MHWNDEGMTGHKSLIFFTITQVPDPDVDVDEAVREVHAQIHALVKEATELHVVWDCKNCQNRAACKQGCGGEH